jgi:hypothetical protein
MRFELGVLRNAQNSGSNCRKRQLLSFRRERLSFHRERLSFHRERLSFHRERLSGVHGPLGACSGRLGACSVRLGACSVRLGACSGRLGACSGMLGTCSGRPGVKRGRLSVRRGRPGVKRGRPGVRRGRPGVRRGRLGARRGRGSNPRCGFEHGVLRKAQNSGSNCRLRQLLGVRRGSLSGQILLFYLSLLHPFPQSGVVRGRRSTVLGRHCASEGSPLCIRLRTFRRRLRMARSSNGYQPRV